MPNTRKILVVDDDSEFRDAPTEQLGYPFPAAVEDACAATAWIAAHAAELAIEPTCLAVAGDSAGGTLAAVVCQSAKGSGFKIALQVLLCPLTDIAADSQSRREFAEGPAATVSRLMSCRNNSMKDIRSKDDNYSSLLASGQLCSAGFGQSVASQKATCATKTPH
jgi:acetyl esterase/lipase